MVNFLYCFDENYNFQAFASIISLLDKVSEKINIYVIHKNEENINFFPKKILNHIFLNSLVVNKFDKNISNFPNLYDAHVSEATYYRLFCKDYLPVNLETILYIDADIICYEDPISSIKTNSELMIKNKQVISSKTESSRSQINESVFKRLKMNSSKYFNAGVMNINFSEWTKLDVDFNSKLIEFDTLLEFWDQDLLNHIFDGNYEELDSRLNKVIDFAFFEYEKKELDTNEIIDNSFLLHFAGSHKPWSVNGIMCNLSEIYQVEFRKISRNTYHITHKIRSWSVYLFLKNIFNLKFFRIEFKLHFLRDFLKSLLRIDLVKNEN
ncbi:hypothetical protein OA408_00420 [Acidimicrobiaceae bacterium]|nr:hypothetical protein [Acidimicrobiaceae bacterium]